MIDFNCIDVLCEANFIFLFSFGIIMITTIFTFIVSLL